MSVQTLHVGSYDNEGPLIAELHHTYLPTHDLTPYGKHHEIYLNDPRKTEPAKLKSHPQITRDARKIDVPQRDRRPASPALAEHVVGTTEGVRKRVLADLEKGDVSS